MNVQSKMIRTVTFYLSVMFILSETFAAASITVDVHEKTIASMTKGNLIIALTNETGKLMAGANHFCVLFQRRGSSPTIDIQEVSVAFTLLVGRIHEARITTLLDQNGPDRYCGQIDLGPQYYRPASYYAVVRYVEAAGKKKSARLSLTVK
jgi:hypothetical protein